MVWLSAWSNRVFRILFFFFGFQLSSRQSPQPTPLAGKLIMAGFLKNGTVYAAGIACFMRGIP